LCLHEICGHAVQMAIWDEQIRNGSMNPACGVTTVHSPEAFCAEGLGQTVHLLFATRFELPPELWLRTEVQYHNSLVMQNAHLMLYQGESFAAALEYASEGIPFSRRDEVEVDLRERATDPLSRTYRLSYSVSERAIRRLIARMSEKQIIAFFSRLYEVPMTPGQ